MHFSPTTSESIFSPNNQSFSPLSARSLTETISNAWSDPSEQTVQDSSLNDEHQPRSKRTKIIVVGIITGLSLVVIVLIIALVVSLRSTNTTQTGMSTGNVIPYFSSTVAANKPNTYEVGNGGISHDSPCSSHTVVNDPLRNVNRSGIGGTCDNGPLFNTSIGGRWIRFVGPGGSILVQKSPGVNHCGAFLSTWFNGSLPTTNGTISTGDICTDLYNESNCKLGLNGSVINCGNFYVYFLRPLLLCNARYCTT